MSWIISDQKEKTGSFYLCKLKQYTFYMLLVIKLYRKIYRTKRVTHSMTKLRRLTVSALGKD